MTKPTTTTPDPEFNAPSYVNKPASAPSPGQAAQKQEEGTPATGDKQKPPIDLKHLSAEEDQQDEPESRPDEG